ncbi:DUF1206 domain-containing protein [Mesonia ostreae]|uniref:DUF1206 domain-containing protein n=1 Tax=Mesonia ostreae TaxID=861110 RepID=A0ABU2KHW3_9FLAO|nr:DUF1206 domain-containing protein [Mesonia ostreae]MDT0294311.1 DUF1206 domain-containing protein [Mesonia ostreae]
MKKEYKMIAKVGTFSKGVTYFLSGILTLMAAMHLGGSTSGKSQVFDFINKQPFGKVLLIAIALGLICYACWRFIQCFINPEEIKDDWKGKAKRVVFFFGGIIYLGIAFLAARNLWSSSSSGGGGLSSFLSPTLMSILFFIIGIFLVLIAGYYIKQAYQKEFMKKFSIDDRSWHKAAKNAGYFGFYARAFVILILAYIFIRAAMYSGTNEVKGTKEAFFFLQDSAYGSILMGVAAAGLAAYGLFVMLLARYRRFDG